MLILRMGGLRPSMYTRGHPVMLILRMGGLRPSMYTVNEIISQAADLSYCRILKNFRQIKSIAVYLFFVTEKVF